jgi:hypothetical protein
MSQIDLCKKALFEVETTIKRLEEMPPHAMMLPITHYDFYQITLLLEAVLKVYLPSLGPDLEQK